MDASRDQLAMVCKLREQNDLLEREVGRLKSGDGGGRLPPMETIDAKIAAAEARTDTKFAELRGDLAKSATKGTVWGAAGTILAILLAVAAFAGDRFDAGLSAGDRVEKIVVEQRQPDAVQDRKLDEILDRVPNEGGHRN